MSQPQQRANCNNTNVPNVWLGGCFQHYNKRLDGVKIKKNVTQMVNYANPADPPYIPVTALSPVCTSLPICDPCSYSTPCGDGVNGEKWCGPLTQTLQAPCGDGTSSWDMGRSYYNCYYQSNETESLTQCHTIGFRNVIANKQWSGRYSYTSPEYGIPSYWGWCCGPTCNYIPNRTTPDTTKYLEAHANADLTFTQQDYCISAGGTCNCPGGPGPPCPCLGDCGTFDCSGTPTPDCCVSFDYCGTRVTTANAASSVHVDHYGNFYVDTCSSGSSCPGQDWSCLGCDTPNPGDCYGCGPQGGTDPDSIAACEAAYSAMVFGWLGAANGNVTDMFAGVAFAQGWCSAVSTAYIDGCPSVSGDGNAWHIESAPITVQCTDGCGNPTSTFSYQRIIADINLSAGTMHIQQYDLRAYVHTNHCTSDGYCPTVVQTRNDVFAYSATSFSISGISYYDSFSLHEGGVFHVYGGIGTTYTDTEVKNECIGLLSWWDLGDDKMWNGWRTDTATTTAPLVTYDEGASAPVVGQCESSTPYSGDVIGKPGPENIDHMWDALHANYCVCTDELGVTANYIHSYGAWSDQCHVPRATQWTNEYQASNLPPDCAFISYKQFWTIPADGWLNGCDNCDCNPACGDPGVTAPPCSWCGDPYYEVPGRGYCGCGNKPGNPLNGVWMGKFATIIQNQQSYDFYNRPCGNDRFQPSASVAFCITGSDTGSRTLALEPLGPPCSFSSGDLIWVTHDQNDLNGLWKIQSLTPYSITLQDPRYISASTLPNEWMNQFGDGSGAGMVYKLRWQSGSVVAGMKPAICGRIGISDIKRPDTGSVYTASLLQPSYLVNTDTVTIENATGIVGINSSWGAIVIDNQHIGLSGSMPLSQSTYTGNGQMFTPPNGGWVSDQSPKGDYATIEYQYNYRDIGEYARMAYQSASLLSGGDPLSGSTNCVVCAESPSPCPNPSIGPQPRPWQQSCGVYIYPGYSPNVVGNPCTLQCPGGPDFDGVEISMISCSTHCLPFNACKAGVAYYAPPGQDNFAVSGSSVANYKYHGWSDIALDDDYGGKWIGGIKSTMGEPIHMAPPCYCNFIVGDFSSGFGCPVIWTEDDGNCNGYTNLTNPPTDYYPLRNLYEYRCDLPPGAPAQPDGIKVGCSTIAQLNVSGSCGPGNVCLPPYNYAVALVEGGYDGCGNVAFTPWNQPWITYLAELGCCCLDGRFCGGTDNNAYGLNGIICFNNGIVNPP